MRDLVFYIPFCISFLIVSFIYVTGYVDMSSSIHGGQERVIQFLNLKVQAVVSPPWESAQDVWKSRKCS